MSKSTIMLIRLTQLPVINPYGAPASIRCTSAQTGIDAMRRNPLVRDGDITETALFLIGMGAVGLVLLQLILAGAP